jgi:hypothetical protein
MRKIAMPRGSQPGERRRQPGTPNKKTALVNAAFDAATSNSGLAPLDFLLGVMRDSSIRPDWRMKAALAALPYVHVKPERSPATDRTATAKQIEGESDSDPLFFNEETTIGAGSKGPRPAQKAKSIKTLLP